MKTHFQTLMSNKSQPARELFKTVHAADCINLEIARHLEAAAKAETAGLVSVAKFHLEAAIRAEKQFNI